MIETDLYKKEVFIKAQNIRLMFDVIDYAKSKNISEAVISQSLYAKRFILSGGPLTLPC